MSVSLPSNSLLLFTANFSHFPYVRQPLRLAFAPLVYKNAQQLTSVHQSCVPFSLLTSRDQCAARALLIKAFLHLSF